MNKPSRTLVILLIALVALAAMGFALSYFHATHDFPGTLIMFDEDMSDSPIGWMIAIPIIIGVFAIVAVVLAGAAIITVIALAFAAVLVILALLLAATPFALVLGIPILAIYGFVKLVQRDRRAALTA